MSTTLLKKGDEHCHDHEYDDFEVDTSDFTIVEVIDRDLNIDEELIMVIRMDRLPEEMPIELKRSYTAIFRYEDGKPYYRIRGPGKIFVSENGFRVENMGPCHVCGSRMGTIRCVSCGQIVCTRMEDDADPDGYLPEHAFPCLSSHENHDPALCKNCERKGVKPFADKEETSDEET